MGFAKCGKGSYRFICQVNHKKFSKNVKILGRTKKEIEKEFYEWYASCVDGTNVVSKCTFGEFAERWLNNYAIPTCKPNVIKAYKCNLKNRILPYLGHLYLTDITPAVINSYIADLRHSDTKYAYRDNKALSEGSIRKIYSIVRAILQEAFRNDLIINNPCSKVSLKFAKKVDEDTLHYYDSFTYKKVLALLEKETTDYKYVIEFALKTGARRSEIFGVTWADIDFYNKTLTINKTRQKDPTKGNAMTVQACKNSSSIRKITIPDSLVTSLWEYHKTHFENKFVFENIDYDSLTTWFRKWQRKNDIPRIRFHDLRHTHATLLLYKDTDLKTISKRLGHSNIGTTMNVYTHVVEELDRNASLAIDNL